MNEYEKQSLQTLLDSQSTNEIDSVKQFSPWKLLAPKISNALLLTTPSTDSDSSRLSCTSFLSSTADWDGTHQIYLHPLACPSAPIRRLSISSTTPSKPPRFLQLHPRQTLIAAYLESSDPDQAIRDIFLRSGILNSLTPPESVRQRVDTLIVFDVKTPKPIRYLLRVPVDRTYCSCLLADDGTIRVFFFDHASTLGAAVTLSVYSTRLDTIDENGFIPLQLVDSKILTVTDSGQYRFCVTLFKRMGHDYFVWFLEKLESASGGAPLIFPHRDLFCISYHRSVDGAWIWSDKPVPFADWTKSEHGSILWSAAQDLSKIQFHINPISLLRNVEVIPMAKMVTVRPSYGFLHKHTGVRSLCSLSTDVVRLMAEEEVMETRSLHIWKWWLKLIKAAGLFQPCPPNYGDVYQMVSASDCYK